MKTKDSALCGFERRDFLFGGGILLAGVLAGMPCKVMG